MVSREISVSIADLQQTIGNLGAQYDEVRSKLDTGYIESAAVAQTATGLIAQIEEVQGVLSEELKGSQEAKELHQLHTWVSALLHTEGEAEQSKEIY